MRSVATRTAESFGLESLEPRALMAAADLVPAGLTVREPGFVPGQFVYPGPQIRDMIFSVVNMGDRRAPVGTRVRFYLSRDGVLDSGDRAIRGLGCCWRTRFGRAGANDLLESAQHPERHGWRNWPTTSSRTSSIRTTRSC